MRVVFVDADTKETVHVGVIPEQCTYIKKKKKSAKTFQIPGASLATARTVVAFLELGTLPPNLSLLDISEVYKAAKAIEVDALIDACVQRVWDTRDEWMWSVEVADRETEYAWVYNYI
jgi:hypothetical protein